MFHSYHPHQSINQSMESRTDYLITNSGNFYSTEPISLLKCMVQHQHRLTNQSEISQLKVRILIERLAQYLVNISPLDCHAANFTIYHDVLDARQKEMCRKHSSHPPPAKLAHAVLSAEIARIASSQRSM